MKLTNPIFTAKVVAYERLAYNPKVWFKEYELFPDKHSLDEWGCRDKTKIAITFVM